MFFFWCVRKVFLIGILSVQRETQRLEDTETQRLGETQRKTE